MKRNIVVSWLDRVPVAMGEVELVERKGIGHPDSLADGLAEAFSRSLCQLYVDEVGEVLHHNVDQSEVSGGQSEAVFGGGKVLEPPYILLLGRAVDEAITPDRRVRFPVRDLAVRTARSYLWEHFHDPSLVSETGFSVAEDVIVDAKVGKGSQDLIQNFRRTAQRCPTDHRTCRPANDTSFGVGFAPLTETEQLVYEMERFINGDVKTKHGLTATGCDVKVMASRRGKKIDLTIACAMISSRIASAAEYRNVVAQLHDLCQEKAAELTDSEIGIVINHADNTASEDPSDYYLTITGLSLENGDDGSVGRGNRVNGLITPFRPMSMEAAAGKNPVTHVGKLYNVLANQIATQIADEAGSEVFEVQVRLLSQIGSPIDLPALASVELCTRDEAAFRRWQPRAKEIADGFLEGIESLTDQIVKGRVGVF
ncbi:MAG: methionine adenosyltransferase [Euryarchaeota archaeon]|nr:methionine adenosyltransferase [Euryarchaeota archaeon]